MAFTYRDFFCGFLNLFIFISRAMWTALAYPGLPPPAQKEHVLDSYLN